MKYVKLFEEFTSDSHKYDLIKDLPINGYYIVNANDLTFTYILIDVLVKRGYKNPYTTNIIRNPDNAQLLETSRYKILTWLDSAFIKKANNSKSALYWNFESDWELVNTFNEAREDNVPRYSETSIHNLEMHPEDYFKLKHEFRGHNLKRFGV